MVNDLREIYNGKKPEISERIQEFREIYRTGNKKQIFSELAFCILSSGTGPKTAEKSLRAIGDALMTESDVSIVEKLEGVHKYPDKGNFIYTTRVYLESNFDLDLKSALISIEDHNERRDFLAKNREIKGLGYLQASHFLRNIGFSGYAILDKNILRSLYDLGVITDTKPPTSGKRYIEKEQLMKDFAEHLEIDFDHLDLLLWFMIRGQIPR